ncbi:phage polarity suppression protein [Enterobacter hormaechei]|nr:phage polarity suppression protein [Enterobacter hormaechei]
MRPLRLFRCQSRQFIAQFAAERRVKQDFFQLFSEALVIQQIRFQIAKQIAHGAELAAALAPELMNYPGQHPTVQRCAMQHSLVCLREALQLWLVAGEKIHYSAQDNDILTVIGFRPDGASCDDSREKFTPAQNLNYTRRSAELAVQ